MIEKGVVTEVADGEMVINFEPSEKCSSCSGCSYGKGANKMLMRIKTEEKVALGDIVTIEISPRALLSSGFMVFILPLIAFIVGILVSAPLFRKMGFDFNSNTAGILVGLVLMILTFIFVILFERRSSRISALSPKILTIDKKISSTHFDTNEIKQNNDK